MVNQQKPAEQEPNSALVVNDQVSSSPPSQLSSSTNLYPGLALVVSGG